MIFSTEIIEKIKEKDDAGEKLALGEKFWFSGEKEVKRAGLVFARTDDETLEYAKCMLGIDANGDPAVDPEVEIVETGLQYFARVYCKVKREDGSIGNIKLRDYQEEILDNFDRYRFNILMGSRQIGKCASFLTEIDINNRVPFYKIWFKTLKTKKFKDYIKFYIYDILYNINKM